DTSTARPVVASRATLGSDLPSRWAQPPSSSGRGRSGGSSVGPCVITSASRKGIPRPTPRTTGDRHLSEPDRDSRRRRRGPPGAAGRALGPSLEALSPHPVSGSPLPRVVIDPFRNGLRVEVDPVEDDPPP